MSDLLTREEAERLFENWATVGVMGEVAALLLARADGTLQTRQEFIDSLNYEAAVKALYEGETPSLPDDQYVRTIVDVLTKENACSRCGGTGQVYDEVFANEWAKCPYWDHDAGLQCVDGLVVALTEEER